MACPTCDVCQRAFKMLRSFSAVVGWTMVGSGACVKFLFSSMSGPKPAQNGRQEITTPLHGMSPEFWEFFMHIWTDLLDAYEDNCGGTDILLLDNHIAHPDFLLSFAQVSAALATLGIKSERALPSGAVKNHYLCVKWDMNDEDFFKARQSLSRDLSLLLESRQDAQTHATIEKGCPDCDVCQKVSQMLTKFSEVVGWRVTTENANSEGTQNLRFTF